jgi:hypothetical protein
MRRVVVCLAGITSAFVVACSGDPASACAAAGGECTFPTQCLGKGVTGSVNCNPSNNPGGAMCCLPCPSDRRTADGGCT